MGKVESMDKVESLGNEGLAAGIWPNVTEMDMDLLGLASEWDCSTEPTAFDV